MRINDDAHQYGLVLHICGDMQEYGRIYIGTHGRGIVDGSALFRLTSSLCEGIAKKACLFSIFCSNHVFLQTNSLVSDMSTPEKRVLVGMSGGIDSTATCLMLKEQGYEIVGLTCGCGETNR